MSGNLKSKDSKRIMKEPQVIYSNNKPVSVIIDIDEYYEMLERLEDLEDLKYAKSLKNKKLSFRKLDEILSDIEKNV